MSLSLRFEGQVLCFAAKLLFLKLLNVNCPPGPIMQVVQKASL